MLTLNLDGRQFFMLWTQFGNFKHKLRLGLRDKAASYIQLYLFCLFSTVRV